MPAAQTGDGFGFVFNRAGEDDGNPWPVAARPLRKRETALAVHRACIGEHHIDLGAAPHDGLCFKSRGRFHDGETAAAQVFGQRVANEDVAFDYQDSLLWRLDLRRCHRVLVRECRVRKS